MNIFSARSAGPFLGRLRAALTAMSVALLASYFVLVLLQVFFRYVLNESLFWAEELGWRHLAATFASRYSN